jgi:hypothetical protein
MKIDAAVCWGNGSMCRYYIDKTWAHIRNQAIVLVAYGQAFGMLPQKVTRKYTYATVLLIYWLTKINNHLQLTKIV